MKIDKVKREDLLDAFETLEEAKLVERNSNMNIDFQTKEYLIEKFAHCIENIVEQSKEKQIPESLVRLYNWISEGYEEQEKSAQCQGPFYDECETCPTLKNCLENRLNGYFAIPYYVLDYAMKKLSRPAFKLFIFLSRKATFTPGNNHFSRCWLNYNQIKEATGVKSVRKYMTELDELGLLNRKFTNLYEEGEFKTVHQFSVNWYKRQEELKQAIGRSV